MQLIKEKNKYLGSDINIKIPLAATSNLGGLQQSINDYIERETGLSINPVTDGETFKYKGIIDRSFRANFWNGITYNNSLLNAGFTQEEIDNSADVVTNSFFLYQIYDSTVNENQILLHNSYYNGYNFVDASTTIQYSKDDEFSNIYFPESFINDNQDSGNVINFFIKLSFYNAKTGKLQIFYNNDKSTNTTEDKMYFDGELSISGRTYTLSSTNLLFDEFKNIDYAEKVNESLNSLNNEKPIFPDGEQFNSDGTYTEVTT